MLVGVKKIKTKLNFIFNNKKGSIFYSYDSAIFQDPKIVKMYRYFQ